MPALSTLPTLFRVISPQNRFRMFHFTSKGVGSVGSAGSNNLLFFFH